MAIDKSRTSPFVKGVIIFVAITFVLGIAGTAFVPLLESIFNPTATTGTAGSGSTKTPNADMQAEDAGSEDSGSASAADQPADDSATAATRAMKQTSKTAAESGGKR